MSLGVPFTVFFLELDVPGSITNSTAAGDGDGHFENQVTHTQFLCTRSDSLPVTSERASAAAGFSTSHRRRVAHTKTSSAGVHIKRFKARHPIFLGCMVTLLRCSYPGPVDERGV